MVLGEVLAQRYKLCLDVLNNIREQIEDARVKIDYIDDLYLLSFQEQEMEGRDAIDVINKRLSGLVDQRIKNLAYFVMTSNQINLLPEEHANSFAKISYNTEEIYNSTNQRIIRMVEEMLKERGYSLPEDVISFVIFNKLYQLYNAIADSSQTIGDVEGIVEELDEERGEKIRRNIDILKNLRKENLRDENDVKSYHDLKSIENHKKHLNDSEDIAIGAGATDRLEVILDIAKESKQEVDLRDIDLANIDFKRIDFSELGIKLLLTVEQENKYLSMEQRQQRYSVLFERASNGDVEGVEEALSRGLNINTGGEYKKTALVYACEAGRYGVVRWLVERGADVKVLSQGERSLLMHVCSATVSNEVNKKEERVKVINYLIEQGADINLRDREGMTALMHACVSGQLPAIEKLIENGAEVNIANAMGRTALMVAGYHGWLEIVKILVEKGADINARTDAGWKIIEGLLHGEQPENIKQIVEYLMSKGAELSVHNAIKLGDIKKIESFSKDELEVINDDMRGGAVHAAAREGRVDVLEILRKKGVNLRQVDVYGSNALHIACEVGKVDIVGYLIREGLDVNVMVGKSTPIQIAIKSGNLQIASMLKKAGAKPDLESMVALQDKYLILRVLEGSNVPNEIKAQLLHLCCKYNWVEVTKDLIEKYEVSINEEVEGVRAIEIACELGNVETVELLMKYKESKGLELNNDTKEPLLFKAINKNDERILNILLSNGADASIVYGWLKEDALLYAMRMINRNKVDICKVVKRLIESGADLSHKDSRGNTVLHYIAEEGNEDLARIVLEGFKNIKNSEGKTAAQIAKEKGHILRILEENNEIALEEENVIPIEEREGFINVVKPSEKGKEKVYEEIAKKSLKGDKENNTKQTDKKEKLLEANMRGDDRNLLVDGHNRYWYSVSDGFRLLMHIRKTKLSYDNSIPINEGEEYNAYRENREGIFIADPYHVLNFKESFKDDIKRLSGQYTGIMGWNNTIKTIIIPLLDGLHWRSIRVSLFEDNRVSILWDDPYGKNGFTEGLKNLIKQSIINTLSELCEAELEVKEVEKTIDQQGKGLNGYDCGPIVFSNISDYADSGKSNSEFTKISQHMYTIGEYSEKLHNQNMRFLRRVDVRRYAEMSGMNVESIEDRRVEIEDRNIQLLQDKIGAIKLELLSDKQLERINSLPTLYISMIFDIVENNRTWKGERAGEAYSTEELSKAYNHVIMYKEWIENLYINEAVHGNSNTNTNSNSTTNINEQGNQRRESTRNIISLSSGSSSVGNKKDKDCIVSAVYSASYDNPILNDKHVDKLLEAANLNYGAEGVDKLIEIGSDINSYKKFQSLRTIVSDDVAVRLYIKQELGKEQNINKGFIERLGINHSAIQVLSLSEKSNQNLSYTEKLYQKAELVESNKQKAIGRNS
ncbi:ankyrin repeat domain-containing protein [Holosporaceae bacterium 'Namur']|nr:ankyrin repeat domain-containing protein [Holosporaceae bacterium 'Namur']